MWFGNCCGDKTTAEGPLFFFFSSLCRRFGFFSSIFSFYSFSPSQGRPWLFVFCFFFSPFLSVLLCLRLRYERVPFAARLLVLEVLYCASELGKIKKKNRDKLVPLSLTLNQVCQQDQKKRGPFTVMSRERESNPSVQERRIDAEEDGSFVTPTPFLVQPYKSGKI